MKILLLLFIFFFANNSLAQDAIKTIVTVNNKIITNLDISDEVQILEIFYPKVGKGNLYNLAINNLIEETLKKEEINLNNITADEKIIINEFEKIINKLNKITISEKIREKIYNTIKIKVEWNKLISQKYSWKININMNEIESTIKDKDNIELKENLINNEKNKKINIYSQNFLENLKKKSLIKITP